MDEETFWRLIDRARAPSGVNVRKQARRMFDELITLSVEEILAYESVMNDLMDRAYDAALWDAASIMNCGCSDDGFEDFRGWLIAQGKEVYEKALIDPESLVDLPDVKDTAFAGKIFFLFFLAYERKAGPDLPVRFRKSPSLKGTHWDEEDVNRRFPKLAAKFGDCDQRDSIWFAEEARPPDEYDL